MYLSLFAPVTGEIHERGYKRKISTEKLGNYRLSQPMVASVEAPPPQAAMSHPVTIQHCLPEAGFFGGW